MAESALYNEILAAHSRGYTRLFRINAGLAWQGTVLSRTPQRLILAYPRAIKLGAPGISDLIGWSPGGIFTAIECKGAHTPITEDQQLFLNLVKAAGGHSGIARSVADAGRIISGEL